MTKWVIGVDLYSKQKKDYANFSKIDRDERIENESKTESLEEKLEFISEKLKNN